MTRRVHVLYAMGMKKNTLRTVLVAAAIGASAIGAPVVSMISAPSAVALPACKVIPGPACDPTKPTDRSMSPQGVKGHTSGKQNVNDGKTPAIRR